MCLLLALNVEMEVVRGGTGANPDKVQIASEIKRPVYNVLEPVPDTFAITAFSRLGIEDTAVPWLNRMEVQKARFHVCTFVTLL